MKWKIHTSCGNSPKTKMIVDWVVAYGNAEDCSDFLTEETKMIIQSKTFPLVEGLLPKDIEEIRIETAFIHGRQGAIRGQVITKQTKYDVALFLEFSLGKQPKLKKVHGIYMN